MPGSFGNYPNWHAVALVSPNKAVLDKEVATLKISEQPTAETFIVLLRDGAVDLSPPDFVCAGWLLDDESIVWGAPRVMSGAHDKRSEMCKARLIAPNCLLVKLRRRKVPVDGSDVGNPVVFQAKLTPPLCYCLHCRLLGT